jgi:signal transduction histidine kinase
MFRRYPYWGWLAISILLWCINGIHFYAHRQEMLPDRMAQAVAEDLRGREASLNNLLGKQALMQRIFADSLTEDDSRELNALPFNFYCYDSTFLVNWNTNAVIPGKYDTAFHTWAIQRNEKGVFIEKCIQLPFATGDKRVVVLFPILVTYPVENDYLKSHFIASEHIPADTKIITGGGIVSGAHPVSMKDGQTPFSLRFNVSDIQKWVPDLSFLIMLVAALMASISWVHLMIIYLTRNKSNITGLILTLLVIIAIRAALYIYGVPFNLGTLKFFDPRLYASSVYLSSFGDLCINTLCFLWIVVFITRHTSYKTYFTKLHDNKYRYPVAAGLAIAVCAYIFLFVNVVRSLVLDSSISFDVSHFYGINLYTILGLLIISTLTGLSCLVVYIFNIQFNVLLQRKLVKFLIVAIIGIVLLGLSKYAHDIFWWYVLLWLLVLLAALDVRNFRLVSDLFEPHMIFWAIIICILSTSLLHYFNNIKEQKARIAFVELNLSPQRDNIMEYAFDNMAAKIQQDTALKQFLYDPTPAGRRAINKLFDTAYLTGPMKKYLVSIYLYDGQNLGLFNKDTLSFEDWIEEKTESVPTSSPYLFYRESILDNHYYAGDITINEGGNKIGTVIFDLDQKQQEQETVYPELLQPSDKVVVENDEYEYAIYVGGKLITQTNDYAFPTTLTNDTLKENDYVFYKNKGASEMRYKDSEKRTILVTHHHNELLETITLFSYIFVIQVIIAIVILLYQVYLSYFTGTIVAGKIKQLTLRRRVHFSMLSIVFISFVFIGIVTTFFFYDSYGDTNENVLRSKMQVARESIQEYLEQHNAYSSQYLFDSVSSTRNFKYFITNLAGSHKIDINIYDANGNLFSTSQEDIYEKGLISRMIRPDAYYLLNTEGKSKVVQNEKVGELYYLSAYEPLRDEEGAILGYLNVPFFSSEKDLQHQISSILVALINLYAVIFLLSSLLTVGITRWITRSFNVIIEQFARLNLQRNERITWPYDDEIGLLVSEYNKMVNKVEENAALLAQSERETAWREMARQVAHEIKNPLTPMKLNIQYLQQAMRNDNPNIKELTNKVSNSIIEQIDNLSYIASEFSNFAKMPEAKPEELELGELVYKAAELYRNDPEVRVHVTEAPKKMLVWSDRSQLLRVCNNLLENAKQATNGKEDANIEITLKADDGHAVISFKDNGSGISEEVASRIFQPYFTTKTSGTGLGLAMTKKIIEFWKGEIWFETKESEGTTFYIRLPLMA